MLLSNDGAIHGHDLPPTLQMPERSKTSDVGIFTARVQVLEKDMIVDALKASDGNVTAAANQLGITPRMVRYKCKSLGIGDPRCFRRLGR